MADWRLRLAPAATNLVATLNGHDFGAWHHYAVTWDRNTARHSIYVDGVQKATRLFLGDQLAFTGGMYS
jgi:hypothetical protein